MEFIDDFLTRTIPRPTRFYWVVDNKLCGMAYPINKDQYVWLYDKCGVRLIVDLTEKKWKPGEIKYHYYQDNSKEGECAHIDLRLADLPKDLQLIHYPIQDTSSPKNINSFHKLLTTIHGCKGVVAIHCWMGMGRTGIIAAAYLMRYLHEKADPAITRIKRLQIGALPAPKQWDFLREYERYLTRDVGNGIPHQEVGRTKKGETGYD